MMRIVCLALVASVLSGCAAEKAAPVAHAPAAAPRQASAASPPSASSKTAPTPATAPGHAVADPGEAVWHLRAGLNVAALSCRGKGRASVSGDYARMLGRHKALLASAYAGEQRRHEKGLDRHLTQLYNRFAYQPSPERFCANAAAVAADAVRMDSATLSAQARSMLDRVNGSRP